MKEKKYISNKQGECPVCGSYELEYMDSELEGDCLFYDYVCQKCGAEGREWYSVVFDTHAVLEKEEDKQGNVFYNYHFIDEEK